MTYAKAKESSLTDNELLALIHKTARKVYSKVCEMERNQAYEDKGICEMITDHMPASERTLANIADVREALKPIMKKWPQAVQDNYYPIPASHEWCCNALGKDFVDDELNTKDTPTANELSELAYECSDAGMMWDRRAKHNEYAIARWDLLTWLIIHTKR